MGHDVRRESLGDAGTAASGQRPPRSMGEVPEEQRDSAGRERGEAADSVRSDACQQGPGPLGGERKSRGVGEDPGREEQGRHQVFRDAALAGKDQVDDTLTVRDQRRHQPVPAGTVLPQ